MGYNVIRGVPFQRSHPLALLWLLVTKADPFVDLVASFFCGRFLVDFFLVAFFVGGLYRPDVAMTLGTRMSLHPHHQAITQV